LIFFQTGFCQFESDFLEDAAPVSQIYSLELTNLPEVEFQRFLLVTEAKSSRPVRADTWIPFLA